MSNGLCINCKCYPAWKDDRCEPCWELAYRREQEWAEIWY